MRKYMQFVSLAVLAASGAQADIIPGFVNTGFGLSNPSIDPNYSLIAQPGSPSYAASMTVTADNVWPLPSPWLPNDSVSKWIVPTGSDMADMADGLYTIQTTFTITPPPNEVASGLLVSFRIATDNQLMAVRFDGNLVPGTYPFPSDEYGFNQWTPSFMINESNPNAGLHTLEFDVFNKPQNGGNPMGFRLEGLAEVGYNPIPEPSTYALCAGFGLIGFAGYRRFKK